uniref:Inhibitor of growth protein n=1 Tax=Anopheles minimus TaxID=112268 RepID=A0A182VR73_9DIPT
MLNVGTVTVEAHYSTSYVENYLDSVENLPDDVQRHLSRIREIDVLYRGHLRDVNMYCDQWNPNQAQGTTAGTPKGATNDTSSSSTVATTEQSHTLKRATSRIQKSLIAAQELGDEKLQIIQQLLDLIDHKTRQLDQDFMNLGNEFFVRLDYARDDKTLDGGREGNGTSLLGTPGGGSISSNGPGQYGVTGNGTGNGPNASGGYGVSGAGSNVGNGGIGSNSHIIHTSNGTSGNGVATPLGGGNGSGMYGGNNGNGSMSNERSSKRARRTRNEQTGGSANGSNTPNSMCGVSAMEVDPIEDVIGGNSGTGGGGVVTGGSPGNTTGGTGGSSGSVTLSTGGNSGQGVAGTMKQESSIGGNSNAGNSSTSGTGNSHTIISASGSGQTQQNSTTGGNGSKSGNSGGNGGSNNSNNTSGSSGNNGNGNGGASSSGAGGNNSQQNSSNQGGGGGSGGGGKKGNGSGNNTASGSGAGGANAGKKKKRKTGGRGSHATREAREDTPAAEETIDPDEPTYCLCDQISFGEMILCDNDLCPIEWFHFSCVSLISKPKGRWFCPNCRGDRPNVMKPKAQFLKELERYNKEKEEKT